MLPDRTGHEFTSLAVQYYVAARSAAWVPLLPVVGNLYHHAVEMSLKAGLSRKCTLQELKGLGHKLITLWGAFKIHFPSPELPQFDATIADINEFEEIRYPDVVLKNGAQIRVDWGERGALGIASSRDLYALYPTDVDRLIVAILRASSLNPIAFMPRNSDAREMIRKCNPVAKELLGP
jgi:hypothetical protein